MRLVNLLASIFALALAPLTAAAASPPGGTAARQRPNIVVIQTDDQRWDALSCAGHPFLKTPNIDRLAKEGAMFQNAFVTTPLCSPSRASFLTGRYAHAHGIIGNGPDGAEISHRLRTWPAMLRESGYETAYVGKLHMGNDPSPRPGFDRWVSLPGQGRYMNPRMQIDGELREVKGYVTDLLSDFAVEFIKKPRDAGKPFAMIVAHKAVHGPFTPAERHKDLYADEPLPRRPNVEDDLSGKTYLKGKVQGGPGENSIRNMLRAIVAVDEGVGRILAALEETGQLDNTLVVYSSDNGYFFGEHQMGDKRAAYEESIRVPLLMRYPRLIKAGSTPAGMALNTDLAATFLELAGVAVPKDMHALSLVPLLVGKGAKWRSAALLEYFFEKRFPVVPTWQAVRTDRWKYIHYPDSKGIDELYDLQADPYEMKNLIADDSAKATLDQLKSQLRQLLDGPK